MACWLFALEPRLRATIVSGWSFTDELCRRSKHCTAVPIHKMRAVCEWPELLRLAAVHNALLVMNGDADVVIDKQQTGAPWRDLKAYLLSDVNSEQRRARCWFCHGGGHRPYQGTKQALRFIHEQLGTPRMSREQIDALPELNYGAWCDGYGVEIEPLYGTGLHYRGATLPDLGLRPIARGDLAVLDSKELGGTDFTIDGWLNGLGEER